MKLAAQFAQLRSILLQRSLDLTVPNLSPKCRINNCYHLAIFMNNSNRQNTVSHKIWFGLKKKNEMTPTADH